MDRDIFFIGEIKMKFHYCTEKEILYEVVDEGRLPNETISYCPYCGKIVEVCERE